MSPARRVPRFSILVPVWQGADLVHVAIESVLAQTVRSWELIVGDNASTDEVSSVVGRYADSRIRLHRWHRHVNANESFNRTVGQGRADWLIPLGADDRLHPDALAIMWEQIRAAERAGIDPVAMVVAPCRRVDPDGRPAELAYYGSQPPKQVATGFYDAASWLAVISARGATPWNIGSIAFSRSAITESGSFLRPEVGLSADNELIGRLAAYGAVAYIDHPLVDCTLRIASDGNRAFALNRARGAESTPMGAALISALATHAAKREVSGEERRALMAAVARSHLQRAGQHRLLRGGLGRRGALGDVVRAIRADPGTLLSGWGATVAIGSLLAPQPMIASASARWASRAAAIGDDAAGTGASDGATPRVVARIAPRPFSPTISGDLGVLMIAVVLLAALLVLGGR